MKKATENNAQVWCGTFGAASALIVFFLAIVIFSVCGIRGTKSYWSAGVLAMIVSFFMFKDKEEYQNAVVAGIKEDAFIMTTLALMFAGILSKVLTAGHLVDGLMWLSSEASFPAVYMPLLTFLVSAAIGTASGTSSGTVATVGPVLLPLCVSMGCSPEIVCGAIVSGAYFGDNLAPISDTTIASAMTQEVSVGKVVKSRLKYSLTGGFFASIMFVIFGMQTTNPTVAAAMKANTAYAIDIIYVLLPILAVVLMIKGWNLLASLLSVDFIGLIMLVVMGNVKLPDILSAKGIIVTGIEGMSGAIFLVLFAFVTASLARATGFMDRQVQVIQSHAKTPRAAESAVAGIVMFLAAATGGNTAPIAVTGPIARRIMRPFFVARSRTANILDGLSCGLCCFMPHSPANATMAGIAISLGVVTDEGFSAFNYAAYNYHGMALIFLFWFAIFSGWGRKYETVEELRADGVEVVDTVSN